MKRLVMFQDEHRVRILFQHPVYVHKKNFLYNFQKNPECATIEIVRWDKKRGQEANEGFTVIQFLLILTTN